MKLFNDLHYLPMSRIVLPLCNILPPVSFCPLSFCPPPGNRLMIYAIYPCPISFCPLDSFCPHIILPPIILPPRNLLMYTIFPCPISFCPYIILPLYHFASISFCPPIILPPGFIFPPYHFAPYHFAPGNGLMIYTIYPCPVLFCPLH